jgi:hypothetical protein
MAKAALSGSAPIPTEAVGGGALQRLRAGEVCSQHGPGIQTEANRRPTVGRSGRACATEKIEMRSMGFELGRHLFLSPRHCVWSGGPVAGTGGQVCAGTVRKKSFLAETLSKLRFFGTS